MKFYNLGILKDSLLNRVCNIKIAKTKGYIEESETCFETTKQELY